MFFICNSPCRSSTILECKSEISGLIIVTFAVEVAPYWNVNNASSSSKSILGVVEVAPYWNVNDSRNTSDRGKGNVEVAPYWNVNNLEKDIDANMSE